jgi:quercetin dioxygenase-like cupin family protein
MSFIDIQTLAAIEVLPGVRIRAPYGKNLMLSYLEMDQGAVVPFHSHPHEQGGILLKGKMELTIGDEVRLVEPGAMYLIAPYVRHQAVAVEGPMVALDIFTPVREDYAELTNKYIGGDNFPRFA